MAADRLHSLIHFILYLAAKKSKMIHICGMIKETYHRDGKLVGRCGDKNVKIKTGPA
jgi:hypothetical protein